jgi:hypothetical protein
MTESEREAYRLGIAKAKEIAIPFMTPKDYRMFCDALWKALE